MPVLRVHPPHRSMRWWRGSGERVERETRRVNRVFAVRHVAFEDLGSIAGILEARGCGVVYLDAGMADLSVRLEPDDALIVLGGPIGANEDDRYPFLADELRLVD